MSGEMIRANQGSATSKRTSNWKSGMRRGRSGLYFSQMGMVGDKVHNSKLNVHTFSISPILHALSQILDCLMARISS